MCGIAGYFGSSHRKPSKQTAVAIALLACEMESRGDHSWGCTDGETVVRNMGAISSTFVVPDKLPRNFALHTRFATTGKIKQSNSHPFVITGGKDLVVGMHNGIIENHTALNKRYSRDYRVDSQHIFGHIANGLPLDDLEGYGTIVYRMGQDWFLGTFNGGELAVSQTREGLFFASTVIALDRAIGTAGLRSSARDVVLRDDMIYKLTDGELSPYQQLKVVDTWKRWDDAKKAKGGMYPLDGTCASCGDVLDFDTIGATCDNCIDETLEMMGDWNLEVVPDGVAYMCDSCGERINSMEEAAIKGQAVICKECLMNYSRAEVDEDEIQ